MKTKKCEPTKKNLERLRKWLAKFGADINAIDRSPLGDFLLLGELRAIAACKRKELTAQS